MSFADAVERRQADIVRLDGEEEGDEEKESELEREEAVSYTHLTLPTIYSV